MTTCRKLDATVTPYLDGELDAHTCADLDAHVTACPSCAARVAAERSVRDLLLARRSALQAECAPAALRERCAGRLDARLDVRQDARLEPRATQDARLKPRATFAWRARLAPVALAASLVVLVGGAFVYELTDRSSRVMAAELTADHLKCFGLVNPLLGTRDTPSVVEASMASSFGWLVRLPDPAARAGLELVGARPCLYGEGRVAHIMYRHNGRPVSVFMLPRSTRAEEVVEVMGHEAAIWSAGDRTFVLIARAPRAEVEEMASFVHATFR